MRDVRQAKKELETRRHKAHGVDSAIATLCSLCLRVSNLVAAFDAFPATFTNSTTACAALEALT